MQSRKPCKTYWLFFIFRAFALFLLLVIFLFLEAVLFDLFLNFIFFFFFFLAFLFMITLDNYSYQKITGTGTLLVELRLFLFQEEFEQRVGHYKHQNLPWIRLNTTRTCDITFLQIV